MIARDDTLAGYVAVHGRPPAFTGSDGRAYSVGVVSDDDPGPDGRFGAALLFVRWDEHQVPDGHLESDYLVYADSPESAEELLGQMALLEVQKALNGLIGRAGARSD